MGWVFLWLSLAAITQIWLCFRVARSSVAHAVGTFFLGGIAAAYTLFKERDDPETNVTVPFIANLVFSLLFVISDQSARKARVVQNGAMPLVLPVAGGGALDELQANMVGAFRKLSL
jgi:hypothetical protein